MLRSFVRRAGGGLTSKGSWKAKKHDVDLSHGELTEEDEEEEEAPKKAKNPLDLLPPSPFNLDDYKR